MSVVKTCQFSQNWLKQKEISKDFIKYKMKKFSFIKMWFESIFLSGSLAVFKYRGSPAGLAAFFDNFKF